MRLESGRSGLTSAEAARRLAALGPNAVRTHKASGWSVLGRQLRSPILVLLFLTAGLSLVLGDATNSDRDRSDPACQYRAGLQQ